MKNRILRTFLFIIFFLLGPTLVKADSLNFKLGNCIVHALIEQELLSLKIKEILKTKDTNETDKKILVGNNFISPFLIIDNRLKILPEVFDYMEEMLNLDTNYSLITEFGMVDKTMFYLKKLSRNDFIIALKNSALENSYLENPKKEILFEFGYDLRNKKITSIIVTSSNRKLECR